MWNKLAKIHPKKEVFCASKNGHKTQQKFSVQEYLHIVRSKMKKTLFFATLKILKMFLTNFPKSGGERSRAAHLEVLDGDGRGRRESLGDVGLTGPARRADVVHGLREKIFFLFKMLL